MAKVTFVVTLYNKAPYLPLLFDCLRAQRGEFTRSFVFVDDGSKDDSLAVAQRLAEGLGDVRFIAQANGGQARATNVGLAAADGDFIKLIDADDALHPDCTQALLTGLTQFPDASLAYCEGEYFTDGAEEPRLRQATLPRPVLVTDALKRLFRNVFANPTQILVRTEAVRKSGGADERVRHSMEYALMLRLSQQGPFVSIPAVLAHVRIGMSGNLSENKKLTLQESMRAPAFFLRDFPQTPRELQSFVAQRAAKRAWLYRNRHMGDHAFSSASLRRLEAYAGVRDVPAFLERCANSLDA